MGCALDNAAAEAFNRPLKVEYVHRHLFRTRAEARLKMATWIADFYNTIRRHDGQIDRINHPYDIHTTVLTGPGLTPAAPDQPALCPNSFRGGRCRGRAGGCGGPRAGPVPGP
ncbi:integrase core domain-containing protein [Nonomuraea jabiensis]|uniref:integrase core domain-containing protein n=1 Tax=Nonomuraea jabiensis TaxID=882448 RepID=UPI003D707F34